MDCCVCWDMASDEPVTIPPVPPIQGNNYFQRLHQILPPKQYIPLAHPQATRRATTKNCRALQAQLWCKSWTCTQASVIHFANLQEQEQWSLCTHKSKQDKLQPHKCNHKEVRDLQEQSHCDIHCKMQERWDVNTVIACNGWGNIKVGDEWARRNKAA